MPEAKNQIISSSVIKELVAFGVSIEKYVPKCLVEEITKKFEQKWIEIHSMSKLIF